MLSKELEFTLNQAFIQARERSHEYMTVEHLLLALLDNPTAAGVLRACGADTDGLRRDIDQFIEETTPLLPDDTDHETQPTLGFQRVLQRAVYHVQSSGRDEVTGANVLVAIFSEQESQAVFFLHQQDIARLDVVNYISHGISKVHGESENDDVSQESEEIEVEPSSSNPLELYASDLNEQARQGKIDPLIGRELEIERTMRRVKVPFLADSFRFVACSVELGTG